MKKMRVRKWLKLQTQSQIHLSDIEINRLGNQNMVKMLRISRKYKKQVLINAQPKLEIYDEAHFMVAGRESSLTNLNKPNGELTQALE